MPKIEPIDLLHEVMHSQTKSARAGDMWIVKDSNGIIEISTRFAVELSLEASAYKEYFMAARALARCIDMTAAGQFVDKRQYRIARELFEQAKMKCIRLHVKPDTETIKRES